jgi:hypothetical protein
MLKIDELMVGLCGKAIGTERVNVLEQRNAVKNREPRGLTYR